MGNIEIRVLGPVEAQAGARYIPVPRALERSLLARLALDVGRVVSDEVLIDDLWGSGLPKDPVASLNGLVHRLRRTLGTPSTALVRDGRGYVLRVDPVGVDACRFERLIGDGRCAHEAGRHREASDLLAAALSLWRGPALSSIGDRPFAHVHAARLEELRLGAMEERVDAELACGRHQQLVAELHTLTVAHPLRERMWGQLVLALYRSGRQADALPRYQRLRKQLGDELGIEPSAGLAALEEAILLQKPELDWVLPAGMADGSVPYSVAPVTPSPGYSPMVGRDRELAEVRSVLDAAVVGRAQVLLVSGEAGVGKTRLVEELAGAAAAGGDRVVWGRHPEDQSSPAYWSWVQVLRRLTGSISPAAFGDALGPYAADAAALVPEVAQALGPLPRPPQVEPDAAQYRLFESVTRLLGAVAQDRPLVVVLDDLHWAHRASLRLLEYAAAELATGPLLVVGIFRDDLDIAHPLAATLAVLARVPWCRRLRLRPLEADNVRQLVEPALAAFDDSVVDLVVEIAEGNPFFAKELVNLVSAGVGSDPDRLRTAVPSGVRDVVRWRVGRLSSVAAKVLAVASVAGSGLDVDVISHAADLPQETVLDALDETLAAGVVVNAPIAQGGLRFCHALTRLALYEELSSPRRALLHLNVAMALEHLRPFDAALAPALAHHYCQAGTAGPAATWALRASDDALRSHAYDDAVRLARRPLDDNLGGRLEGHQRSDLLIAVAEGEWRRGSRAAALDATLEAARISLAEADGERLAAAALAVPWTPADPNPQLVSLLELSLTSLPHADSERRARLLTRLAWERWYSKPADEVDALGQEAVAMARRMGDDASLAVALTFVAELPSCKFRFETDSAEELETVAKRVDDAESLHWAYVVRTQAYLARGDIAGIRSQIAHMEELADLHRSVRYRWFAALWTAMLALLHGDLEAVEPLATKAYELGETAHQIAARTNFTLQLVHLRWAQGQYEETLPILETAICTGPSYSVPRWRAWLAVALCQTGRWAEAREIYSSVQPDDGGRDFALTVFAGLAEACVALGDVDRAPQIYQLLAPISGHLVVNGGYSASSYGPADRLLGGLAGVLGRWDVAFGHLTAAHAMARRLQTPTWELDALVDLAAMYIDRDHAGDVARSVKSLDEVARLDGSLKTAARASRIAALRARAQDRTH